MRRILILLTSVFAEPVFASEQDARLARLSWTAFECHELARVAENKSEDARLLALGMDTTKRFVEALRAGKVTANDLFNYVPGPIADIARSPTAITADFTIGRIYQAVVNNTFEEVSERDAAGKRLPPEKYVVDPLELKVIAFTKFRQANCELIK